jgi:hypothetical protein
MADEGTGERVIPAEVWGSGATMTGNLDRQTRRLRRCLRVAGVDRPALHEAEATSKAMTWYDLRATGITWRAVRGDDPLRIMHAAGHTSFTTTQGYIRAAAAFSADAFGDVFQALSPLLGEQAITAPRAPHFAHALAHAIPFSGSTAWNQTDNPVGKGGLTPRLRRSVFVTALRPARWTPCSSGRTPRRFSSTCNERRPRTSGCACGPWPSVGKGGFE